MILGELPWSEGWAGLVGVMADGAVVGWQLAPDDDDQCPNRLVRARDGESVEVIAEHALEAAVSGDGLTVAWLAAPDQVELETRGQRSSWRSPRPLDGLLSAPERVVGFWTGHGARGCHAIAPWPVEQDVPLVIVDPQGEQQLPDCPYPSEVYEENGKTWAFCDKGLLPAQDAPAVRAARLGRIVRREGALRYESGDASWPILPEMGLITLLAEGRLVSQGDRAWRADGSEIPGPLGHGLVASPDGRWMAWHEGDRIVRVAQNGAWLDDVGHRASVRAMDASPRGRWLVSADVHGEVILWDLRTRKVVERRRLQEVPVALSVDEDGRVAAWLLARETMLVWEAGGTGERSSPIPYERGARGPLELLEDGSLRATFPRGVHVFDADGHFLFTEQPQRQGCAADGGVRWCPGVGGIWREQGGVTQLFAHTPSFQDAQAVLGGLLLTGGPSSYFLATSGDEVGVPVPLAQRSYVAAWWALASLTGRGQIELWPLEKLPTPTFRPSPAPPLRQAPAAPLRQRGEGPPIQLVLALDGTGSFRDEMGAARQVAFELLDAMERGWTRGDRVGVVTFHHRYAQIRSPLVPLSDEAAAARLREGIAQIEVAQKGPSVGQPLEFPDEHGSDPSTGLLGALSLLEGAPGRRVIVLVTDGVTMAPGPGSMRAERGYVERRWPEVINELHPEVEAVLAASEAAVARAQEAGIEVWVLAVQDARSCDWARAPSRCVFVPAPELVTAGRSLLPELRR